MYQIKTMKQSYLIVLIVFLFILTLSCKKQSGLSSGHHVIYKWIYSEYVTKNTMNNNSIISSSSALNINVELIYSSDSSTITLDSIIYQKNKPNFYVASTGSPNLLQLHSDSIIYSQFMGGVGYQQWLYKYGVKQ